MTVVSVGTDCFEFAGGTATVVSSGESAAGETAENPLKMPVTIMTSAERRMIFLRSKCVPACLLSCAYVADAAVVHSRPFSAMRARDDEMRLTL